MYLAVHPDGRSFTVEGNLTVADCLAASQGLVHFFRLGADVRRLVSDNGRMSWAPVRPATDLVAGEDRLHV